MQNKFLWNDLRGLNRLLARETNISDIVQYLSGRDPTPWVKVVGFIPELVTREAGKKNNNADLLLSDGSTTAVVELKLGHEMSDEQKQNYESLPGDPALFFQRFPLTPWIMTGGIS